MEIDFSAAVLLVGAVLGVAAGLSGWLRGTVLSISVLAVAAGLALAVGGVLDVEAGDPGVLAAPSADWGQRAQLADRRDPVLRSSPQMASTQPAVFPP